MLLSYFRYFPPEQGDIEPVGFRHRLGARGVRRFRPSYAPASRSRRQLLNDEFFVQPVTAVVAPPNPSAHKPAGNCASWDDDRP